MSARSAPSRVTRALGYSLSNTCWQASAAAVTACLYALWVLSDIPTHHPSADSHYHFTVAREIGRGVLAPDPARGLPFTVLRDMPVDHYWAFHVLLAPFTWIGDYKWGLRWAASVGFAAVIASLAAFISARRVPNAALWALCAMLFANQDWRYLQLRGAQCMVPLSLLIVELAGFRRASRTRQLALVGTAFIGIWCYHGALVLLPYAAVASCAAHCLDPALRQLHARVLAVMRDTACVATGLIAGLLVNPYMDARFSTFRFLVFHVTRMLADPQNLYTDVVAEFHGFRGDYFVYMPEWGLLFLATVGTLLWVASRWIVQRPPSRSARVIAAVCILGMLLTWRAVRMREYSVPVAFALLAVVWSGRSLREPGILSKFGLPAVCALLLLWAMKLRAPETRVQIGQSLPTDLFHGAASILERNGEHPILNLAEADYGMLRIETPRVVCVHSLSRYFIYPYRDLYDDVWLIYRDAMRSDVRTRAALERFARRGVRIVATHGNRALDAWALAHPESLRPVFQSTVG
ncbi:MAG TPA: hypothetical protein VFQ61_34100, partial [Polyangiaceae bacterium]|nr:hypothetical protein [Polyangiaceae bacterium]